MTTIRTTARRALGAVSLTAVLALAACGGGQGADQSGSGQQQGSQQSASDGGQQGLQSQQGEQGKPDLSGVPDPVAEVNGTKISKDEFSQAYESQYQQATMSQQSGGQAPDEDSLKKQVADQLVDNQLLTQAAGKAGIKAGDDDIDKTLDTIAQQNGMKSGDEVVKALEQQGSSEKQVRQDAASQFELTEYIDKKAKISDPSEKELKQQYAQLKKQYEQAGQAQSQTGGSSGASDSGGSTQVPAYKDVKDQLAQQAKTQQEGEAATKIAQDLRKDADVTINL